MHTISHFLLHHPACFEKYLIRTKNRSMENYVFVKKINGTDETGIADISKTPPELMCLCSEEQSKRLLLALNIFSKQVVSGSNAANKCEECSKEAD